jgi:hypothetical protein
LCDQFFRCWDSNIGDQLIGRKPGDLAHINELAILRLAKLKYAEATTGGNFADANRNRELFREMRSDLLGQLFGPRRHDVDILCHPGLIDVSIYRLGAEEHRIATMTKELQHRFVDCCQRKRLFHCKLPECQYAVVKHDSHHNTKPGGHRDSGLGDRFAK